LFVLSTIALFVLQLAVYTVNKKVCLHPPLKVVYNFHPLFSNPPKGASNHQILRYK